MVLFGIVAIMCLSFLPGVFAASAWVFHTMRHLAPGSYHAMGGFSPATVVAAPYNSKWV
jgi:hypothetical protein